MALQIALFWRSLQCLSLSLLLIDSFHQLIYCLSLLSNILCLVWIWTALLPPENWSFRLFLLLLFGFCCFCFVCGKWQWKKVYACNHLVQKVAFCDNCKKYFTSTHRCSMQRCAWHACVCVCATKQLKQQGCGQKVSGWKCCLRCHLK